MDNEQVRDKDYWLLLIIFINADSGNLHKKHLFE